ncbi:MAG: YbaK/EbsC family protein [Thiogranum sp.]|nr:YbaK/EbsC family protein [Thiogranum sp.]
MAVAETVKRFLDQQAIRYELVPHPHTGSSHETAKAAHVPEDHIAKGVVVKDQIGYALVVIPADNRLEMEHLRKQLNRDLQLASEPEIGKLFSDCEIGAVPPLGVAYGVETFLDDSLTSLANLYFEAGDHDQLIHVNADDFATLLAGVRHGHYSHH